MKVSLKWLNQIVDLSGITPEEIAHKLTFAGIEVEGYAPIAMGSNLVIGQILKVDKHPESEHLSVLQVDEGEKFGIHQIICGAPNVREGMKVIVALPGCKLPALTISQSKIRGVLSDGMCCALNELGVDPKFLLESQVAGIEELPEDAPIGRQDVLTYLGLDDVVLDLKLLANRSDCLSVYNVAQELGGLFMRPVKALKSASHRQVTPSPVTVKSLTDKNPLFAIKTLRGIKVGPSPKYLQNLLMASGIRSINNIVDIGNYIMLLTGQPLHMYDLDKLPSYNFVIRDDLKRDWVALDEKHYDVLPGDIAITVNDDIMCLGGVMGSLSSAVDASTKNIAIEAAYFDQATVRKTATRLNLVSESSQRFAKGINPHQTSLVLELAADLIQQLCGSHEEQEIIKDDRVIHQRKLIASSVSYINRRLGTTFSKKEIFDALSRANIRLDPLGDDAFTAGIPFSRIDIGEEADLSEEVIRIIGLDKVQSILPVLATSVGGYSEEQQKKRDIRDFLSNRGLYETVNYTLVSKDQLEGFRYLTSAPAKQLLHPMTPEREYVRTSILHSLVLTGQYNVARQNRDFGLYEVSEVYDGESHHTHLGILLAGEDLYQQQMHRMAYSYYHVKGYLEGILKLLSIDANRYKIERLDSEKEEFHPGRSAVIKLGKEIIGVFGELHPNAKKAYDFGKLPVVALEVNLSKLFALKTSPIKMVPTPRYPSVSRDLAIVVKNDIAVNDILRTIKKAGGYLVKQAEVFDVYVGEHIADGYQSIALSITYQDDNKTLVDKEISLAEEKIKGELYRLYAIELRK